MHTKCSLQFYGSQEHFGSYCLLQIAHLCQNMFTATFFSSNIPSYVLVYGILQLFTLLISFIFTCYVCGSVTVKNFFLYSLLSWYKHSVQGNKVHVFLGCSYTAVLMCMLIPQKKSYDWISLCLCITLKLVLEYYFSLYLNCVSQSVYSLWLDD